MFSIFFFSFFVIYSVSRYLFWFFSVSFFVFVIFFSSFLASLLI